MAKKSLPLSKVYRLIEPGPVVLLSTVGKKRANIMTLSWHAMMEFDPPLVGCVIGNRNYSFGLLREARECVINIPTVELAKQVVDIGNSSGRKVDKFKAFGLTPGVSKKVKAPHVIECYANLECKVADTRLADKYNFFVLEVVKAWVDPKIREPRTLHHRGKGAFMVAGETMKLPSKMK